MEDKQKVANTLLVFDEYEKRFAAARLQHPLRSPWQQEDRQQILQTVKDVLRYEDSMVPQIKVLATQTQIFEGVTVQQMQFESWEHFYGIASLYVPEGEGKKPLVVICHGHAKTGRLGVGYQRMAMTLARQGAYVLLSDNVGQGSREGLGHASVPEVFYCGKSVQGLIVAETIGWIRYMQQQPYVDPDRIGACGNSGGGTLTTFLCALAPELAAIASCGYPSEFSYLLQKDKKHCDCNLLPGTVGKLEMWECYSLFAPKPLLLECGSFDNLLPVSLFYQNSRKVKVVYDMMDATEQFRFQVTMTKHSWDTDDVQLIGEFFAREFGLEQPVVYPTEPLITHEDIQLPFPEDAITTAQMVQAMTGITAPEGLTLPDVVKPQFRGQVLDADTVVKMNRKSEVMRILAQYEISL